MSALTITSPEQFQQLLQSKKIVVAHFFDSSNYVSISSYFSDPLPASVQSFTALVEINVGQQKDITDAYGITDTPALVYFRHGVLVTKVHGSSRQDVRDLIDKMKADFTALLQERSNKGETGSGSAAGAATNSQVKWRGAELPRGYGDVTDQIEIQRSELLNYDASLGNVRVLFDGSAPSALPGGKAGAKDWVESDTDEQLMLYIPFQSVLKLHTLQITSLLPEDDDDDEVPMRPRTIKLFLNKSHNLGFDEAEDMAATQDIELSEKDWNDKGTANIPLRFVKFQKVTSLVLFIVDGDSELSEKVRLDRIRLIGEAGEKREMGKLEKIGEGAE